tara:strand:- start:575 stop:1168 length:594 start_codon:yes stop_codon:yes gene_type:complete
VKEKFIRKYMGLAKVIANDQNPCLSRRVGTVVVDPSTNGIVGAGYNGPPEGTPHCNDVKFLKGFFWPQLTARERVALYIRSGTVDSRDVDVTCEFLSKCNECPRNMLGYSSGKRAELCSCQHAERNALNKLPIPANGLVMFCWCGVPCIQCAGSIINAAIKEVHCLTEEDYHPTSRWLFEKGRTELFEHDIATLELK